MLVHETLFYAVFVLFGMRVFPIAALGPGRRNPSRIPDRRFLAPLFCMLLDYIDLEFFPGMICAPYRRIGDFGAAVP